VSRNLQPQLKPEPQATYTARPGWAWHTSTGPAHRAPARPRMPPKHDTTAAPGPASLDHRAGNARSRLEPQSAGTCPRRPRRTPTGHTLWDTSPPAGPPGPNPLLHPPAAAQGQAGLRPVRPQPRLGVRPAPHGRPLQHPCYQSDHSCFISIPWAGPDKRSRRRRHLPTSRPPQSPPGVLRDSVTGPNLGPCTAGPTHTAPPIKPDQLSVSDSYHPSSATTHGPRTSPPARTDQNRTCGPGHRHMPVPGDPLLSM
jgi:hypothetical protein